MSFCGYIYIIENKTNGKVYVGQTIDPSRRERQHFGQAFQGCPVLRSAMGKYGKENFDFILLEKCLSEETLNEREIYWIRRLNSKTPSGYNLGDGGTDRNRILSSSHKTKLSLAKMGKLNPNYGRPDAINNIKWVSGEGQSPWIGRKHPESTKQKISQTLRSKTHCKRGHVFDSDNTMVVKKTGQRLCKQCHRARARATYARAKGGNNG